MSSPCGQWTRHESSLTASGDFHRQKPTLARREGCPLVVGVRRRRSRSLDLERAAGIFLYAWWGPGLLPTCNRRYSSVRTTMMVNLRLRTKILLALLADFVESTPRSAGGTSRLSFSGMFAPHSPSAKGSGPAGLITSRASEPGALSLESLVQPTWP
jgi:hypothetical protein